METTIISYQTRQDQIIFLYLKAFPKVAAYISRSGGNEEDAKDIFQDALVVFYEKEDRSQVQDEALYLTGIAKHLWLKKQNKERSVEQAAGPAQEAMQEETARPVSRRLLQYVETAGKKCMEMLKSVYYDNMSMQELAGKFGFSGERSATAQKYKCLEKIRGVIKQRELSKEDFYE
jgi:DNA-directed RNA polymerase specialized sigma24 family protein